MSEHVAPVEAGPYPDMNTVVGRQDILLVTLDTLRYDVAAALAEADRLPNLARVLPADGWEARHSPANFPYAAHHAMLAGFLPQPVVPGPHPPLFAGRISSGETSDPRTWTFDASDLPGGLAGAGYHTACIGGVGFFSKQSALGSVLPRMFAESHWDPELGVGSPISFEAQAARAEQVVGGIDPGRRLFLFVNVSALHQPNWFHLPGAEQEDGDNVLTQAAALEYVDRHIGRLFRAVSSRGPCFTVVTSDHGTAYGEAAHDAVWTVPYAQFTLHPGEW